MWPVVTVEMMEAIWGEPESKPREPTEVILSAVITDLKNQLAEKDEIIAGLTRRVVELSQEIGATRD